MKKEVKILITFLLAVVLGLGVYVLFNVTLKDPIDAADISLKIDNCPVAEVRATCNATEFGSCRSDNEGNEVNTQLLELTAGLSKSRCSYSSEVGFIVEYKKAAEEQTAIEAATISCQDPDRLTTTLSGTQLQIPIQQGTFELASPIVVEPRSVLQGQIRPASGVLCAWNISFDLVLR